MQASGQGPGAAAGGDEGQGRPGDSGGPDGPAGHEGPGGGRAGEAGGGACGAPRVAPALRAPMAGGSAMELGRQARPAAIGASRQQLQYSLRIPFPTPVEAEMVRRAVAPNVQHHHGAVQKEFIVCGSVLAIRLTAEDPDLLQISVSSCIQQLTWMIWTMRGFVPPHYATSNPAPGG